MVTITFNIKVTITISFNFIIIVLSFIAITLPLIGKYFLEVYLYPSSKALKKPYLFKLFLTFPATNSLSFLVS